MIIRFKLTVDEEHNSEQCRCQSIRSRGAKS